MFKKLIKWYYKNTYHKHNMVLEHYTEDTCMGRKSHSRVICTICNWVDYDNDWTSCNNWVSYVAPLNNINGK